MGKYKYSVLLSNGTLYAYVFIRMENTNQWSDRVLDLVKKSPCNKYSGDYKNKAQTRRPNKITTEISEQKNLKP